MKIAIYDIIHIEQVIPLLKVADKLSLELLLFTNEEFRNDLLLRIPDLNKKFSVFFKPTAEREYPFMQRAIEEAGRENVRVFLLNSIDSKHLLWYRLMKTLPEVIFLNTLHEINNLFTDIFTIHPKKLIRQWGKKKFIQRIDGFALNTPALLSNISTRNLTQKKLWLFPQAIFDENDIRYPDPGTALKIVLPGTIDVRRRDYDFALNVYEKLLAKENAIPQLYIAGPPIGDYGRKIIERAIEINTRGGMILYSNEIIPEYEFDNIVNNAHLLWSPQQLNTSINDGIQERYGETKNSGNTHVALRFARPMLIPAKMKTALAEQKSVLYYSGLQNCVDLISMLTEHPEKLLELHGEAIIESRNFSVDVVAEKFRDIINYYQSRAVT
ncbi:hypothetical protein [Pollutibacter soli]|uniref:hypothetical protein n=1 Tax=Pollutibacter soli TaxID=3034157 RepID=UPI0030137F2B